jgi:hypothetical protein
VGLKIYRFHASRTSRDDRFLMEMNFQRPIIAGAAAAYCYGQQEVPSPCGPQTLSFPTCMGAIFY